MRLIEANRRRCVGITTFGILVSIASAGWAQDRANNTTMLEEVVVTAQKRAQDLQDVGLSVSAVTALGLEKAGINDVTRLEQIVPGLVFAKSGNDAKLALRGANSNSTFADNTSIVGVFVDGVYKPRASQQTRAFFDVERLEVLKGPQGTLYGRNTLGGAINLYTKAPDLSEAGLTFGLTSTYSRFNTFRNEYFANAAVSDDLGLRLAVQTERSDGWVENEAGRDLGIADSLSFRASALWDVTDNINALLRVSRVQEDGNPAGMFAIGGACRAVAANGLTDPRGPLRDCQNPRRGSGGTPAFDTFGDLEVARDFVHDDKLRERNVTLEVNVDYDAVALKSITSYTDYETVLGNDADYSANPHAREWVEEINESYTQELQLSSVSGGALEWTTGLYASTDELYFAYSTLRHTEDDLSVRPEVLSANGFALPLLIGTPLLSLDPVINGTFNSTQFVDSRNLGAFGQLSYSVLDNLRLIAGIRYSDEKKEAENGNAAYVGSLTPAVPAREPGDAFPWIAATATDRTEASETFTSTTWRAGVEFDAGDDIMVYATASTGFLSGVMNSNGTVTEPQESLSYEVGLKSRFLDNRVQLNAAVYRAEYSELATTLQIPNPDVIGQVITVSSNGGEIDAQGVELSLEFLPTENLFVAWAVSYMDSEYGEFGQNLPQQVLNGVVPTENGVEQRFIDLSGERPPYTPEWTTSLRVSYDFQFATGLLTPAIQFRYSDEYFAHGSLPFDPAGFQDSFTQTDVRVTWNADSGKWSAEAFAENLEDELINQRTQHGGDGLEQTNVGFPRNYGVRLKLNF